MDQISRLSLIERIQQSFQVNRIVCLLGPRQCGKTTLARLLWKMNDKTLKDPGYFDLERPQDIESLNNPDLALSSLKGLIVIDEIQRRPDLFSYLRYLHDQHLDQQFLILGSASASLIHQSSESLAGRISFIEITPFSAKEVNEWRMLLIKGGFPRSYLLSTNPSMEWRQNYMRTYIEQDLGTFGLNFQPDLLRRFWFMLAHYHGQILNASTLAQSLGVSQPTIVRYLSYLKDTFMLRILKPWFANTLKRQVKSPKVYYRDSGLLHYVLGVKEFHHLIEHPRAGASFEGFCIEEIIKYHKVDAEDCYFWASHNKAELDLLIVKDGKKHGFEFKLSDAPKLTPSMRFALEDLELDSLKVIYPGDRNYALTKDVQVESLSSYLNLP
ncbi:MAG: ATP-binding protein [Alphaproteobacteria bacterium]|nr:ATP-binding protein [Alphaproteobacteria bacterium]